MGGAEREAGGGYREGPAALVVSGGMSAFWPKADIANVEKWMGSPF